MLDFFDKLQLRDKFIENDFDKSPFQFLSAKRINLNRLIDKFLEESKEKEKERTVIFTYENENFIIFKNPINFKMFYEDYSKFKAYNEFQLISILNELSTYYYFYINDHIENDIKNINSSENIKEIILYPFFTNLFMFLNFNIELNNPNMDTIKIKKELLEPLQLYIEKKEIIKNNDNPNIFDEKLIEEELIFILNQERKELMNKMDLYAERYYIIKPMKIVGSDGIGKSITLQFYSLVKLEGYYKFYFNLKLFEKYGLKNYFFIELIRGFLSKENNINNDLKNYMNCIKYMQKLNLKDKNFIEVLKELINYIKQYQKNYIIILDQFSYEYITDKNFEIFFSKIDKKQFRLIICCTLNDGEIKNKMFKEYERDILWINDNSSVEEDIPLVTNEIKPDNFWNIELNGENRINLKDIYLFKKRAAEDKLKEDALNKNKNENPIQTEINNEVKEEKNIATNINISDNNKDILKCKETSSNDKNKDKNSEIIFEPKYLYKFPVIFPKHESIIINYNRSPVKIYYNNLVDLKQIIKEKEPEEIYNFMRNFKYLSKYYKKFNTFRFNQNLNNIKDNNLIMENFKKRISNKICEYIEQFYSKGLDTDEICNNIYNHILKLKRKMNKYIDKKLSFKKIYKFSKKYPMKYIIIEPVDQTNNIRFNDSIISKKFKLNYSFPFIEYVLNKMIDEYDNETKIDIKYMSGSAFGNALELKLRNYMEGLKQKVEIRNVWSLNFINENIKKNKLLEIENKTFNSIRYKNLEDICIIKPLKDSNFFYFHPENSDNFLLDSILIINHGNNNFSMIAFRNVKYTVKIKIKSKEFYRDYILQNVKTKFEKLYDINIISIYLWFILGDDNKDNYNNTCYYLDINKFKYSLFSNKEKCLFENRNGNKIDNLLFFINKQALIYSRNYYYNEENNLDIDPSSIVVFEDKLYKLSEEFETINYEKIRESYFMNNYGLKIGNKLRDSIIETLKLINPYKNNFYFLFLFCFPFKDLYRYDELNDELVYILKYKDTIYFIYKDKYYEIDYKNQKLISSKAFRIELNDLFNSKIGIIYNEEEIDVSLIKGFNENYIIYLYKIYYIGELENK